MRFRKLPASLNCIRTISTTREEVRQVLLVNYKISEDARDIKQDGGYSNSYKQQMVKHVLCVFANPFFHRSLRWFHLNRRNRFGFIIFFFQQTYFLVHSLLLQKFLMRLTFKYRQILPWAHAQQHQYSE